VVDETWIDTGGPQDLLQANRLVLQDIVGCTEGARIERSRVESNVYVAEGSRIVNSEVQGPSIIGRDVLIVDSHVGPGTSIHDGCRLEAVQLEGSILLERAVLQQVGRLRDSIIGRDARLTGNGRQQADLSLLLSDHSQVQLT
jgi:glucose-1-phosphate thymidylyltransferase